MMKLATTALIGVVCALLLACAAAMAADIVPVPTSATQPTIVDWEAFLRPVFNMLIGGVLGWICLQVTRRWDSGLDAKCGPAIQAGRRTRRCCCCCRMGCHAPSSRDLLPAGRHCMQAGKTKAAEQEVPCASAAMTSRDNCRFVEYVFVISSRRSENRND
jgi:hypothetical protein